MVGLGRFELPTSRLSSARSNQLSYRPDKTLRFVAPSIAGRPRPWPWLASLTLRGASMAQSPPLFLQEKRPLHSLSAIPRRQSRELLIRKGYVDGVRELIEQNRSLQVRRIEVGSWFRRTKLPCMDCPRKAVRPDLGHP